VRFCGGDGATAGRASIASLARRSGTAAATGAHAPGPTCVVYRPPCLEHGPNRARLSGAVERGRTVPAGQEGRSGTLGALTSVGRRFVATTHLCHSTGPGAGEPGASGPGASKVDAEHDEDVGRD